MPRNFYRRIEAVFPIEDGNLRERVITELLALPLQDNLKAHIMRSDGSYHRCRPEAGEKPHRSQMEFIARTLQDNAPKKVGPKSKYPRVKLAPRPGALKK